MKRFANKSKFSPFNALLQLSGIRINEVHIKDPAIMIIAEIKSGSGFCLQITTHFQAVLLSG